VPRAKGGFKTRQRRKKWLKLSKGYRGAANNVYKKSRETVEHALAGAYGDRKRKKGDFKRLWIIRINAAVRQYDLNYSRFIDLLKKNNIEINRKVLSEMAIHHPEEFEQLIKKIKG
jgi:large subunit ribosomal protein L20